VHRGIGVKVRIWQEEMRPKMTGWGLTFRGRKRFAVGVIGLGHSLKHRGDKIKQH